MYYKLNHLNPHLYLVASNEATADISAVLLLFDN
jgi:hypothetical protein